ncbi:family 43 glycosylhydrolase [Paenibacillus cisolokensis]|uniref:family 43 glycosylhydrolase n=1 Tax=Paenibacillus cisolokensis TaxID=1658519 RepID=UPI003D2A1AF8
MNRRTSIGILLSAGALAVIIAAAAALWGPAKKEGADNMTIAIGQTMQNPLVLEQEWEDYGIGDPFVLRHDGKYYLYCSTKDWRVGVKAWSSDDLVTWRYEGLVTEEPLTEGAYAPEVVYWNGSFYMYTSPAGKGHYVLQSDKPTGPFVVKTENLGLTIDGSVFIDDDGKWLFTHAESGGIMAAPMTDPFTIEPGKKLNTSLGHWTEGSMIVKRNGRYFITYTGNHVFSKGYRVNYGVSREAPDGVYAIPENNPLLISTADGFNGLGHSSTVMGPDMDSYYLVYHDLAGRSAEGPPVRRLNIDRLAFNGDKLSVLGPTHGTPVQAPAPPAFADIPEYAPPADKWEQVGDGRGWLSRSAAEERHTAEFNFVLRGEAGDGAREEATLDMIFAYENEGEYRAARLDEASMTLSLVEVEDGIEKIEASGPLPDGMDLTKLHTVRAESDGDSVKLYWDGLLRIERKGFQARGGKIGYAWNAGANPRLRYTAFSNEAGGSSDRKAIKPVPGSMEAVHGTPIGRPEERFGITPDGSGALVLAHKGDGVSFPVHVARSGDYLLSASVSNASAGSLLAIEAGGKTVKRKLEPSLFADDGEWTKVPLGLFELEAGTRRITVRLAGGGGEVALRYVEAAEAAAVPDNVIVEPTEVGTDKRFGGDAGWTDYDVSFDVTLNEETIDETSVLLRTTNESEFPDQVADSFMGYQLTFRNGRVVLYRVSYENVEEVESGILAIAPGETKRVVAKLRGAALSVFADGGEEPILTWTDPNAFLHGRVGKRGLSEAWTVSPLTISSFK